MIHTSLNETENNTENKPVEIDITNRRVSGDGSETNNYNNNKNFMIELKDISSDIKNININKSDIDNSIDKKESDAINDNINESHGSQLTEEKRNLIS